MGCPFHDDGTENESDGDADETVETGNRSETGRDGSGIDRRGFMQAALAIGGSSALSTTVGLFGMPETVAAAADDDGVSVRERANRQHSWNAYERRAHGTFLPPEHHLLLLADYEGDGKPSPGHRKRARDAFDRLEEAFEWGHEGLLFTVSYSMSYFDRFDEDLPRGLRTDNGAIPRMLSAQQLIDGPTVPILNLDENGKGSGLQPTESEDEEDRFIDLKVTLPREDPVADDDYDLCIHLASDHVQNLLAAEQALWGEQKRVNDVSFRDANLKGILSKPEEYPDRRVGFAGNENLDEKINDVGEENSTARQRFDNSVDEGADLSMGYNDLYKNSMPREDNVTILEDQRFLPGPPNWQPPGAFANGSIMHVSRLDNDLEEWYGDNDDTDRRHRMFSPHHDKDDVGNVGENLGNSNAPDETKEYPMRDLTTDVRDVAERTEADFRADRNIGHAQKTARARAQLEAHFRNEDGGPPLDVPQRDDPVAREREDDLPNTDGNQTVETGFLRRDFNTVDNGQPGTHFVALQAFSIYLAYIRHTMNGVDWDTAVFAQPTTPDGSLGFEHEADDGRNPDHGILEYVTTQRRGNFIVPPITQRALPHASAVKLVEKGVSPETGLGGAKLPQYVDPDGEFGLEKTDGEYRVTVEDRQLGNRIDPESVRFGFYRDVNAGGGADLESVDRSRGRKTFVFDEDDTRLPEELGREENDDETPDDETVRARLYAERQSDRKPVFGTTTVETDSNGNGNGNGNGGRSD